MCEAADVGAMLDAALGYLAAEQDVRGYVLDRAGPTRRRTRRIF